MSEHRTSTLASGVRVITERMENLRSVALGFWIGTGSAMESDDQAGLSHLLEHMLFRGAGGHSSREIDELFDAMGAEINAGTDRETTSLYTRVLDRHLERALTAMGEMVWDPRFEDLAAEREVVLEEIAMYEDDPQDRVFDLLGEAVFGSHPLGRAVIGRAEVVRGVDGDGLRAFHDERYRPERLVLAAAGSVDHERLCELIEQACPAFDTAKGQTDEQTEPAFERRVRFLRKDTEQYHLCLGGRGISRHDKRRFALRVLEGVLGGTSSSRLFQAVRERRGLAYSVFSFSNLHAHTGEVGIYVGTRPENLREAMSTIAEELQRFVEEPASEQELERSRENVKGRMALALESTAARMSRLGSSLLAELPILTVDEIIERIEAVTVADLRELACELFAPERLSLAGVGAEQEAFLDAIQTLQPVAS
ncbi:MAG TPA: pitrilysin family protein [Solirubrobacteraceae bacterium]|nr:pitrilysin family protein [Solirubrobacteraceae bacterium]